jgi:hypothetical protein
MPVVAVAVHPTVVVVVVVVVAGKAYRTGSAMICTHPEKQQNNQ